MVKMCTRCGHDFNGTLNNSVCVGCRRKADDAPMPYPPVRYFDAPPCPVAAPGGNGLDCTCDDVLAVVAAAAIGMGLEAALADSPDFSGGGGDFGGGGASGSW